MSCSKTRIAHSKTRFAPLKPDLSYSKPEMRSVPKLVLKKRCFIDLLEDNPKSQHAREYLRVMCWGGSDAEGGRGGCTVPLRC